MNAEISSIVHTTIQENPLVRIDAPDERLAEPLRKYFSAFHYGVVINHDTENPVLYHIVLGDKSFVKTFFHDRKKTDGKLLVIVWDAYPEDMRMFADPHVWIALVDPGEPSESDVQELLQFYFTGRETLIDRRHIKTPAPVERQAVIQESRDLPVSEEPEETASSMETSDNLPSKNSEDTREESTNEPDETHAEDRVRIEALVQDVYSPDAQEEKVKRRWSIRRVAAICVVAFFLPFAWYALTLAVAGGSALVSSRILVSGNATDATRVSRFGLFNISQGKSLLPLVGIPFTFAGRDDAIVNQKHILIALENILQAEMDAAELVETGRRLSVMFLSPVGSDPSAVAPASETEHMQSVVSFMNHRLGVVQAMMQSVTTRGDILFSLPLAPSLWKSAEDQLARVRDMTLHLEKLLVLYPEVAGFRQPQTYLVILQNSMELRPTGGFIGSLAIAQTHDGRLSDLSVQDVYAVDGQLKGHVDPPGPLRDLLGAEHWYLRDSNWDPDFRVSGERARWFYAKETGTVVDGVIGISTPFITDLLKVTGPIDLPDIQDRITADNFFGKSLFYTRDDFFPGSTQKEDFLGNLLSSLVLKITQDHRISPAALYAATIRALEERTILFSFADPTVHALVSLYGWDGAMDLERGCAGARNDCISEGIALIDANLSVNKANYFLRTSRIRLIEIADDGGINETDTFTYQNTSTADDKGGGSYRNYGRLYMPPDSAVSGIFLDGVAIEERKVASDSANIRLPYWEDDTATASGRIIGVAFDVPEGQSRNLSFTFRRGTSLPLSGVPTDLGIYDYKQPGATDGEEKVLIRYPLSLLATTTGDQGVIQPTGDDSRFFLAKQGQLEYNTTLSSDYTLRVTFTRQ